MDPTSSGPAAPRPALLALAAAALAALVYANALGNGWALDDELVLGGHPALRGGLADVLSAPWWPRPPAMYRPLTLLSFAAERAAWGGAPAASHAVNVLLHAAAAALVVFLLLRLGASAVAALAGAAVFAVHPVHVEAVANTVGRAEVLAAVLVLCACLLHLSHRIPPWGRAVGVGVLYLLALGAKEIAVTLPALLVLLDTLRAAPGRVSLRTLARGNAGMVAATVASLALFLFLRERAIGSAVGAVPAPYMEGLSTTERWAAAVGTWPEYLRLLFFPRRLSAEWGPGLLPVATWGDARAWIGLLVGVAAIVVVVRTWNRARWVSAAVLWFAIAVFPVSNLPFGAGALVAERSLYLPSVALAFLAPPLVAWLTTRAEEKRRLAALVAGVVIVLLAARTWTRTPTWKSTETVFLTMAEEAPELWSVQWRLAKLLNAANRVDESLAWYRRAQETVSGTHVGMAAEVAEMLVGAGRPAEAEREISTKIPGEHGVPAVDVVLARARFDQGNHAGAIEAARAARRAAGGDADVAADAMQVEALAMDAAGLRREALATAASAARSPGAAARRPARWLHAARLMALAGDTAGAAAALDSARAPFPPAVRAQVTLEPPPEPSSPRLRGWLRPAAPVGPVAPGAPGV